MIWLSQPEYVTKGECERCQKLWQEGIDHLWDKMKIAVAVGTTITTIFISIWGVISLIRG